MPIDRRPLREQVREEVLLLLERGEISANHAINEGQLAARLGVSRTPLREALITLEHEGVIQSHSGKGFRFAPLSRKEFTDLCEVLASLEMLALQLSDPAVLDKVAPTLLRKAYEFSDSEAPVGTVERYDDEWHDLLLSGCTNDRLMELLTSVKVGLRRYEHLQVGQDTMLQRAAEEHEQIAQCLVHGDLAGALTALKQNWHSGMQRILELMDALPAASTGDPDGASSRSERWWQER
ncbi:MAG TPA: GntR family transcriptional regulator [Segeticoccus sp.]|uniref:GntR family transcriptional regulator n=1 Tax=Segeticoccus sp. TaxID=2706531 RepID=UPI002D80D289|nr:GntR family transcriptional regulator [Segeticoccus sp.]HET8598856.1 GntR family transcriptional regulator [Segeticoccus sp.]